LSVILFVRARMLHVCECARVRVCVVHVCVYGVCVCVCDGGGRCVCGGGLQGCVDGVMDALELERGRGIGALTPQDKRDYIVRLQQGWGWGIEGGGGGGGGEQLSDTVGTSGSASKVYSGEDGEAGMVGVQSSMAGVGRGVRDGVSSKVRGGHKEEAVCVAMVGDGVNDALALSQAHFAVALAARSPVAMQVLQVSLSLYLYLSRAQNKP